MKILIVEDEPHAAEYLRQGLAESGYLVEVALNGTDGLYAAMNVDHDLVILDVMLPGIDGFAVLSALRTSKQVPVLMLTARGQTSDKLKGFELGPMTIWSNHFSFPNCSRGFVRCSSVAPKRPPVVCSRLPIWR